MSVVRALLRAFLKGKEEIVLHCSRYRNLYTVLQQITSIIITHYLFFLHQQDVRTLLFSASGSLKHIQKHRG